MRLLATIGQALIFHWISNPNLESLPLPIGESMTNPCYGGHGGDCYGSSPVYGQLQPHHHQVCTPIPAQYANLPVFTDHYSPKDQCQILTLAAGDDPIAIDIPLDPNTGDRAQWAGFSSLDGDYVVSLSGGVLSVDSDTISNTIPLFNPEKIPLTGAFKIYLWSKNGATVRVCWYRSEPCNYPFSNSGNGLTTLVEKLVAGLNRLTSTPPPYTPTVINASGAHTIPAGTKYISISSRDGLPYKVAGETLPGDYIVTYPYTSSHYTALAVDGNLIIQEVR